MTFATSTTSSHSFGGIPNALQRKALLGWRPRRVASALYPPNWSMIWPCVMPTFVLRSTKHVKQIFRREIRLLGGCSVPA